MNWGAGLLQVVGKGGAGGFGAVKENNKDELDRIKKAAVQAREDFLRGQDHSWRKEEIKDAQAYGTAERLGAQGFQSGEKKLDRNLTSSEGLLNRKSAEGINSANNSAKIDAATLKHQRDTDLALIKSVGGNDKLQAAQLEVVKQTEEMIASGVPIARINELRATVDMPPLSEEITGTTEGGMFSAGTAIKELVPQQTGSQKKGIIEGSSSSELFDAYSAGIGKKEATDDFDMTKQPPEDLTTDNVSEPEGLLTDSSDKPTTEKSENDSIPVNPDLPNDPKDWNVKNVFRDGKQIPVAIIDGQEIPLTENEISIYYKARSANQSSNFVNWAGRNLQE